jgi:hypothetical protein
MVVVIIVIIEIIEIIVVGMMVIVITTTRIKILLTDNICCFLGRSLQLRSDLSI